MYCFVTIIPSVVFFFIALYHASTGGDQTFYREGSADDKSDRKSYNSRIDIIIIIVCSVGLLCLPILSLVVYCLSGPVRKLKLSKQLGSVMWYVIGLLFLLVFSIMSMVMMKKYDEGLAMWYISHQIILPLLFVPCAVGICCSAPIRCFQCPLSIFLFREIRVLPNAIHGFVLANCLSLYIWGSICFNNSSYFFNPIYNITAEDFLDYSKLPLIAIAVIIFLDIIKNILLYPNFIFHSINRFLGTIFFRVKEVQICTAIVGHIFPTFAVIMFIGTDFFVKILLPIAIVPYCLFYSCRMIYITMRFSVEDKYQLDFMTMNAILLWIGFMFGVLLIKGVLDMNNLFRIVRKGWSKGVWITIKNSSKYFKKKKNNKRTRDEIIEDDDKITLSKPIVQHDENTPLIKDDQNIQNVREEQDDDV